MFILTTLEQSNKLEYGNNIDIWTSCDHVIRNKLIFVTGFMKTIPNGTRNEIQFIAGYSTCTLALPRNTKHIAIDDQVCFHWRLIADPVKPLWCNTASAGPVNGINKDVTGARVLTTTVLTCPMDWVSFCHLLKAQHCRLYPYGRFNPPPATHLPPSPTPPPLPAHPL